MLIQRQKYHLNQLLEKYSFQHLRPPPEVYEITLTQEQIWRDMGNGQKKRHIFWKVQYTQEELNAIEQIRHNSHENSIFQNFHDQLILKHLYATKFDIDKTFQRLEKLQAYHNDKLVTKFGYQTLKKLESGNIYSYGYDKQLHPIVIVRADKFKLSPDKDFDSEIAKTFNSVYFLLLVVMNFKMVPYHNQKYVTIMDFNDMDLGQIPFKMLYEVMTRMNIYYCGNAHRAYLFNTKNVKKVWNMATKFMPARAIQNIHFIDKGVNEEQILKHVNQMELEQKYGGKLPNLTKYWPPQSTNAEFDQIDQLSEMSIETDFYSVENNQTLFQDQKGGICAQQCTCPIM